MVAQRLNGAWKLSLMSFHNDLRVAILRILQECLTNVRRHSRTSKVLVGITQDDRSVCIQVQDWGIGFDVEKTRPRVSRTEWNPPTGTISKRHHDH